MFTRYTQEEVAELIAASSKTKKTLPPTQDEIISHSIRHVRVFDEIEIGDTLTVATDIKINKYNDGDKISLEPESCGRIYYIISGKVHIPISGGSEHVELGKDQIFGEAAAFAKVFNSKQVDIADDNTMIFSFKINKNEINKDNALAFIKLYDSLLVHMANKLLWFDMY